MLAYSTQNKLIHLHWYGISIFAFVDSTSQNTHTHTHSNRVDLSSFVVVVRVDKTAFIHSEYQNEFPIPLLHTSVS